MKDEISYYLDIHKERIKSKISASIDYKNRMFLVKKAIKNYFEDKRAKSFHIYYSQTVSNKENFLSDLNFFRQFKRQYSLQGIDNAYLKRLEENKTEIISLIGSDEIASLYFKFFYNIQIQHGDKKISRNLSSFFAKLVHTFAPDRYCALDNPIKKYFGLEKESFYIAFIVINKAYQEWSEENLPIMKEIKSEIATFSKTDMTNLKILDLIFWYIANREIK